MRHPLHIGNLIIDGKSPPLIIAEIGINHGGNLDVAKTMVDKAHAAGAKCIKHQTHIVNDEMTVAAKNIIPENANESIFDIMSSCSLSYEDEYELKKYIENKGMIFLSTPFSKAAADRLHEFDVCAYKIGSGECNNYPLIKYISSFGKPMIVSTGMNDLESIKKTVQILNDAHIEYALLHTTNLYPTEPHLVRLGAMQELAETFPNVLYGLSDHTLNNNACLAATALGASILERHFTDTKYRKGPDIICSMDPLDLFELIHSSKEIFLMRGGSKNYVLHEEQMTRNFAFATVCTIAQVNKGEIFSKENLWVKRPGIGKISAEYYESLLGRAAARDIPIDEHLNWSDVVFK